MALTRRLTAALGAVPLVVAALTAVAGPATAATPPAQPIAGFCGSTTGSFTDVAGDVHADAIACAAGVGITDGGPGGLPASQFGPHQPVTRGQMASFVARLVDAGGRAGVGAGLRRLPSANVDVSGFSDVAWAGPHAEAIARLAGVDIVAGGPGALAPFEYGPSLPVTRGQMATLLNRAVRFLTGSPWTSGTDYFPDDATSVHQDDINALAAHGVTTGTDAGTYQPQAPVTRDQMASFLVRTLAALHQQGLIGDAAAAAPPAPTTGTLSACTGDQLLTSESRLSAGAGHIGLVVELRNISPVGCTLAGYPGADVVTDTGQTVSAQRTLAGYLGGVSGSTYPTVALQPGDTASATVEGSDVPNTTQSSCPAGKTLRTTPPGTTATVSLDGAPPVCMLQVHPVVPGTTGNQRG